MEATMGRERATAPPAAPGMGTKVERERSASWLAASEAVISSVLGDDDLLREILLRLGFPTSLVRAALVCRRWFRIVSGPAFLRRFRDLHPPRLLGFYVNTESFFRLEFVPLMPQPPELAAVLRRGVFSLDAYESFSLDADDGSPVGINAMDCRNGRFFVGSCRGGQFTYGVQSPLHPGRGIVIVPPPPMVSRNHVIIRHVFSREGETGDEMSYFWFSLECNKKGKATAYLYMLQDDAWRMHTSATMKISGWPQSAQSMNSFVVVDDRVYLVVTVNYILVFDWTSSSFSTIPFPEGVDNGEIMLSGANDSGLYLVHVKGLKLSIWCYRRINGGVGDWFLSDTFCLRDIYGNLRMSNCTVEGGHTTVVTLTNAVGDHAEFVFLVVDKCVVYLDVKSRALRKVYEVTETDEYVGYIRPFMMIWPPIFPALKE